MVDLLVNERFRSAWLAHGVLVSPVRWVQKILAFDHITLAEDYGQAFS